MSEQTTNIHTEHRKRIKSRFLSHGLSAFEPHEILEFLLYYALPRGDTNPIAHELIKKFGSLGAVFNASINELCETDGISEHSAILIKLIPQLAKEYLCDINTEKETYFDYDKAGRFFVSKFIGSVKEAVYVALFDNGMHMIDCILVSEGDVNFSHVSVRTIVSCALSKNASAVMLAHNHPGGTIIPSGEDLSATNTCQAALNMVDIKLVEHYIVSGSKYMGIRRMRASTEKDHVFLK